MIDLPRIFDDFEYFAESCLRVQDKETLRLVPFRLKPVQRRLARAIIADLEAGKPARFIVLKARREGVSTVVQAVFFWLACTRRHQSAATISHHDSTTRELFEMTERFYKALPVEMRPMRNRSQRGTVLELANPSRDPDELQERPGLQSVLRTFTFENEGAGQAANSLHRSEVGLWGEKGRSVLTTSTQVVPYAPWTIIVDESTARGVGNLFYERWMAAERAARGEPIAAELAFTPFFIAWFEEPANVLDGVELGELDIEARYGAANREEQKLRDLGVADAQLAWRRYVGIDNLCEGKLELFHQEYPASPTEAFLSTGRPYFDPYAVERHKEDARDAVPVFQGDVVERDGMAVCVARRRGPLRIWQEPVEGEDYVLVCDPSEGLAHGDPQNIVVSPRSRLEVVAEWNGHVDRDALGDVCFRLAKIYGDPLVAIEMSGGWGHTPLAILRRRGYTRLYQRRMAGKKRERREQRLGFEMTPLTRPMVLDALDQALRDDVIVPNSVELLEECEHFVISESGKPEAEAGFHDDRVTSTAILCWLWITEPRRHKQKPLAPRQVLSQVTGY